MTESPSRTQSIAKGVAALVIALAAVALVELALRLIPKAPATFSPDALLDRQGGLAQIEQNIIAEMGEAGIDALRANQVYRDDARTFWRLRKNAAVTAKNYLVPAAVRDRLPFAMTTNAQGFRGPAIARAKSPGALRVIATGNSSTFGWGVNDDETYPSQLAARLRAKLGSREIEVMNAAIPGFTTFQGSRLLADEILALTPDYVVLSYGFNDSRLAASTDSVFAAHAARPAGRLARAASHLEIYRRLTRLIRGASADRLSPAADARSTNRVPVAEYESRLREMVRAVTQAGARPMLLLMVIPPEYADAAARVARDAGIPLLETRPYLLVHVADPEFAARHAAQIAAHEAAWRDVPAETWRSPAYADGIHPSGLGHGLIAEWVAEVIAGAELEGGGAAGGAR
jgi:lysophospholipase L1-like esterase